MRQLFDQEGVILTLQANWFSYLRSYSTLRVLSTVMYYMTVENAQYKSNTIDGSGNLVENWSEENKVYNKREVVAQ